MKYIPKLLIWSRLVTGVAIALLSYLHITHYNTQLEIIGIILIIRNRTNDVPSIYHAVLLRRGKPIKRHKLFNG